MNDYNDYGGDDLKGYNDWGISHQFDFYADEDIPQGDFDYDDHEDYDPATDVVDVVELGIEVTSEGFLLEREILIFADDHEEANQRILVMTCWDGELPF